jgi:hypothetical protein
VGKKRFMVGFWNPGDRWKDFLNNSKEKIDLVLLVFDIFNEVSLKHVTECIGKEDSDHFLDNAFVKKLPRYFIGNDMGNNNHKVVDNKKFAFKEGEFLLYSSTIQNDKNILWKFLDKIIPKVLSSQEINQNGDFENLVTHTITSLGNKGINDFDQEKNKVGCWKRLKNFCCPDKKKNED